MRSKSPAAGAGAELESHQARQRASLRKFAMSSTSAPGRRKPDLSGRYGWGNPWATVRAKCTDTQISREFINIASTLKNRLPCQPWATESVKKTKCRAGFGPERLLHAARTANSSIITAWRTSAIRRTCGSRINPFRVRSSAPTTRAR